MMLSDNAYVCKTTELFTKSEHHKNKGSDKSVGLRGGRKIDVRIQVMRKQVSRKQASGFLVMESKEEYIDYTNR